jgi:hypothetical protein
VEWVSREVREWRGELEVKREVGEVVVVGREAGGKRRSLFEGRQNEATSLSK